MLTGAPVFKLGHGGTCIVLAMLFDDKVTFVQRSGKKKSFENHSSVSWNITLRLYERGQNIVVDTGKVHFEVNTEHG